MCLRFLQREGVLCSALVLQAATAMLPLTQADLTSGLVILLYRSKAYRAHIGSQLSAKREGE